jgi:hypothetical protein
MWLAIRAVFAMETGTFKTLNAANALASREIGML